MSEHAEQSLVMQWAEVMTPTYPELRVLHAVQNWAGVKSAIEGGRRKREGVKAGMPDLHLPVSRNGWASLYIEMKRRIPTVTKTKGVTWRDSRTSEAQHEMQKLLEVYGNCVATCFTAEQAQDEIVKYLTPIT